jgi:hypothetical protein
MGATVYTLVAAAVTSIGNNIPQGRRRRSWYSIREPNAEHRELGHQVDRCAVPAW